MQFGLDACQIQCAIGNGKMAKRQKGKKAKRKKGKKAKGQKGKKAKRQKGKKAKRQNYSTPVSNAVSHQSTNGASASLTSKFRRVLVEPSMYGRSYQLG
jgi:hypothetical protein